MTKSELAERSGVSVSFLSNLTTGKANPSLKVMTAIALALDKPLSFLLESIDWNKGTLDSLAVGAMPDSLPPGYERISVVLPEYQAFLVKKWGEEAIRKLEEKK